MTVDPVVLNIPDYFTVLVLVHAIFSFDRTDVLFHWRSIRPQDARDIFTIRKAMKDRPKEYGLAQMDADILLMLDNARKYNGADSFVGQAAAKVEESYEQKRKLLEPSGKARKTEGKLKASGPKRPRLE